MPIILLYTRFVEFQLDFLMTLISRVADYLPDARWLVVGKGYFEEEKRLQEMAQARGLAGRLIFTGWVPQTALPHYFAAANAAVYPYDDTLLNRTKCSIKLLDLLSAGVPVIASRVGQNIEYISHGKTGLLVPPHDVEKMAEALLLVLNNSGLQRTLGQEAARRVNRTFRWETLVESVEDAYRPTR
jgi:glycosyltransferase involved in cell wall biosynthesis